MEESSYLIPTGRVGSCRRYKRRYNQGKVTAFPISTYYRSHEQPMLERESDWRGESSDEGTISLLRDNGHPELAGMLMLHAQAARCGWMGRLAGRCCCAGVCDVVGAVVR